jgi:hypothetical protein
LNLAVAKASAPVLAGKYLLMAFFICEYKTGNEEQLILAELVLASVNVAVATKNIDSAHLKFEE